MELESLVLSLVRLYMINPVFALLVDTVAALGLLVASELLIRSILRSRITGRMIIAARTVLASILVLIHEYIKEGYFFKPSDLPVFPPRSHESFLAFLAALSIILRRALIL
ncbi:hypothetical protein Pyrde_0742 [Pyrodictium delaneyi]|uniref:Uncharacterized protein n=1 Tax=Pyrodictium delaneyi TaxID=1273541 RepID=A0A0P0N359_9CREN|nr:hypothetical protein [Pyrodictium delaneyi]ALL00792.1 hypothetical protein Pyrde_0742 [Pyrodictium delaneyi]OWJ55572.1 hypothetical protein Pdsh_01940 [Pyrodictium delaneyi]